MKKRILTILTLILISGLFTGGYPLTLNATNFEVYYQKGDVITIKNQPYLAVANSQGLEILRITPNDKFQKMAETFTTNKPTAVATRTEHNTPYAYVIAGYQLQKYDLSDFAHLEIVNYSNETSDYFYNISTLGEQEIITSGLRGAKLRDNLFGLIKTLTPETSYGSTALNKSQVIVITSNQLLQYEKNGTLLNAINLPQGPLHSRYLYVDRNTAYVPTATSVKKFTFTAEAVGLGDFAPITPDCSGVSGLGTDDYIYFVNGWGISKLDKNLQLIKARPTDTRGGWAAGVKATSLPWGKRILVFNGSNILLMNEELDILDIYTYTPMYAGTITQGIDRPKYELGKNEIFSAVTHGFLPNEVVEINYTNAYGQEEKTRNRADNYGNIYLTKPLSEKFLGLFRVYVKGIFSKIDFLRYFRVKE